MEKGIGIAFVGGSDRKKALEQLGEECNYSLITLSIE